MAHAACVSAAEELGSEWLLAQLAQLQREKNALAHANAELVRDASSLRARCALLEADLGRLDARLEAAEERADAAHADAGTAAARALAAETRAAAAEAKQRAADDAEAELIAALTAARTELAQLRFEQDASALQRRRERNAAAATAAAGVPQPQPPQAAALAMAAAAPAPKTTPQDQDGNAQLARANLRVGQLEVLLADTARANAQLARELAARRQALEALCSPRRPLAERCPNVPV